MSKEEKLLNSIAYTTWDAINNAFEHRIAFGEDAITSINLLNIKNQNLRKLAVEDTRIDESIKGCDFELWVGSHSDGWMKYAIQAKKLGSNERYNSLAHKVRGKSQLSILESYSRANNAIPLYCFLTM